MGIRNSLYLQVLIADMIMVVHSLAPSAGVSDGIEYLYIRLGLAVSGKTRNEFFSV